MAHPRFDFYCASLQFSTDPATVNKIKARGFCYELLSCVNLKDVAVVL